MINKAAQCQSCPNNANCAGGDNIVPIKDYWRKNENSTLMVACPIEDVCLKGGGVNGLYKAPGLCSEGLEGPLCMIC